MNEVTGPAPEAPPRVDCTIDADGRVTFVVRARTAVPAMGVGPSSRLLLRLRPRQGEPETTLLPLDLEPVADEAAGGGCLRAVLPPRPALAEGRWDVYLLREPSAARERLRPGLRDLRALVDGHTRDWPSPVAVRVPYTTVDGFLALRTWLRTAHAEVEGIDTTDRSMTVRARVHGGVPLSGPAVVRLHPRDGQGRAKELPARVGDGGPRFSFAVDYAELAAEGGSGNRVWDIRLQPEGGPSVRVGRLLDDVADRKDVFVHPAATVRVAGPPPRSAAVRPYYTVDNDLSVEVRPAG